MDDLRERINSARRAGYSDAEIANYLKQSRPDVGKALESGYSPEEVVKFLAPAPTAKESAVRKAGIAARGAAPAASLTTLGTMVGGAVGGPVGAGVGALTGSVALPAADALASAYQSATGRQIRLPSEVIRDLLPGPRAETPGERVIQAGGEALLSTMPQVAAGRAMQAASGGAGAVGRTLAQQPIGQILTAPAAAGTAQAVGEATESPLAGLAAGMATGAAAGIRPRQRESVPSTQELSSQSKANYQILDQSGFRLDTPQFQQFTQSLIPQLRSSMGFVPSAYPKVSAAIREMRSGAPKDVAELQALRKIIAGAAKSSDPQERMIATDLMDRFDDYLINAPASAVVGGNPQAIKAWEAARADYSKMKKSEIFTDMVENAELATGSKLASMQAQLSALARNDRRMRLFTPDEREAIKAAAKGSKIQDVMDVAAKFTPMTPAAAIFTAVAPGGAFIAAGGMTARAASTKMTEGALNRLSDQMRLGRQQQITRGITAGVPVSTARGAIASAPVLTEQLYNQLAPENRNALNQ